MPDVPHFAVPFRFVGARVAVVEQDSPEEIAQCVEAILATPEGSRIARPEFGLPDQAFTEGGASRREILEAVSVWEPRADVLVEVAPDRFDELVSRVSVTVGGAT